MRRALRLAPALLAAPALVLAGCAGEVPGPVGDGNGPIAVVASTNVYGSIAATIGGASVEVTSLIETPAQDPHSYEASAQDQLAISHAALIIENGGGYDPFVDILLEASGNESAVVVSAVEISGLLSDGADEDHEDENEEDPAEQDHEHIEGANEHVWYSFEAMQALARELARELGELDSENAAGYEGNYEAFAAGLAALEERAHGLRERWEGIRVVITEPVPLYLLAGLGLENLTPEEFSEAIEEGADVPPLVLQETLGIVTGGGVGLLAYNEQTASPETERLRAAAERAGVPVVSFTETLPDGADYLSWMADNVAAVESALG